MSERVRQQHLQREAVVYVRQSSAGQVRRHTESARLQVGLRDRAHSLGWAKVQVICDDLGVSAGGFANRAGFQKLVTDVSLLRVGIILCFEASRLSRNSKDWAQLFELCGYMDTLVADLDQVYDLSIANDRLLLGVKGSLSEYELTVLRQRCAEAIEAKARRGELQFGLPAGLVWNDGKIELVADIRIQQTLRMVFNKFDELGSARQVLTWFRDQNLQLASSGFAGTGGVRWCTPTYRLVLSILRSPLYAGAYAYGKTGVRTRLVDGQAQQVRAKKPMDEWKVLLVDHHEGYISWEKFLNNQQRLAENAFMTGTKGRKSARGGRLLLAGLLRCARCGHMLHVAYGRHHPDGRYECRELHKARAAPRCIRFAARRVDQAVRDLILESVQDEALDAAVEAATLVAQRAQQQHEAARLELEQARYEAQLAQRRYESVDPEQRLVAVELEKRWNTALERVEQIESRVQLSASIEPTGAADRNQLNTLAQNLEAVWELTDAMALKQRIARLLIREIVANNDDDKHEVILLVHWVGGRHTELRVPRPRAGEHGNVTSEDVDAVVRRMAGQWSDGEIAGTLNRLGLRTGVGNTWTAGRVLSVRKRLRLVGYDPSQARPMLTLSQAADALGVGPWVIRRLVKLGVITADQPVFGAPWRIEPDQLNDDRVRKAATEVRARKIRPGSEASAQLNLLIPKT